MSQKGWFPHSIGLSDMKQHKYSQKLKNYIGENDVQIGYEASLPGEFKVNQKKAFHVTPDIYLDKIKFISNNILNKISLFKSPF